MNDDFQDSMAFDRLNRETSVIQQAATSTGHYAVGYKKTTLSWDNDSRLTALADYKDSSTQAASGSFTYDRAGRLTGLDWFGPEIGYGGDGEYLEQLSWGHDNDSRVTSLSNAAHTSEALTYSYDHDWQLTSAAGYGGYGGYGGGSWTWDANGDPSGTGRIVGTGNRLLSDGTYNFEYDKSGHMVKKTAISGGAYTIYDWNNRGNLFKATDYTSGGTVTQTVELWYDPFNDLIGRKITTSTGTTTARFVYDLAGGILPSPLEGEGSGVRGSGNAVLAFDGNESLTDRYLRGPVVDQILSDERFSPSGSNMMPSSAGTVYWALGDNEGSVRDWITYGSLVDHIVYDPFGRIDTSGSSMPVSFAFGHNGVFYDPNTGLEWHNDPSSGATGRWLMPSIQRWMSEDPLGLGPDANPYRDETNSPTNFTDPSGHLRMGNDYIPITEEAKERQAWALDHGWFGVEGSTHRFFYEHGHAYYGGMAVIAAHGRTATWGQLHGGRTDDRDAPSDEWSFVSWLYAGDGHASKNKLNAALDGAGQSYTENAGTAHRLLKGVASAFGRANPLAGLATAVDQTLTAFEGSELHQKIMAGDGKVLDIANQILSIVAMIGGAFEGGGNLVGGDAGAGPEGGAVGDAGPGPSPTLGSEPVPPLGGAERPACISDWDDGCFPAGTFVESESGRKRIETIQAGERVWAFDLTIGKWALRPVLETYKTEFIGDLVAISIAGDLIEATYHHPFWVVEGNQLEDRPRPDHVERATVFDAIVPGRWVDAGNLQVGDVLLLMPDRRVKIERLETRRVGEDVYNVKVEQLENYAVGSSRVLSHNNPGPCPYFGTPGYGIQRHNEFEDNLMRQTPANQADDWTMRTGRGLNGVDATFNGDENDPRYPGFQHAELKPATISGCEAFLRQMGRWQLSDGPTQLWMYDANGKTFSTGWNFIFGNGTIFGWSANE